MSLKEFFSVIWRRYITKECDPIERLEEMARERNNLQGSEFVKSEEREILLMLIQKRFPQKDSGVLELIVMILERTNLNNEVYECFSSNLFACDLKKVKNYVLVSRVLNHFLCSFESRSVLELVKMLAFLSMFLDHVGKILDDDDDKSRNLVPIYLGIQYVLSKLLDETHMRNIELRDEKSSLNAKNLCCQCFELLLEIMRPTMKFFETSLVYNPEKSFTNFSISFRNQRVYYTTSDKSVTIYFSLLNSIVRKMEGLETGQVKYPAILEFAEGNVLSIFTNLSQRTQGRYVFKFDFLLECLCRISLNRSSFFHIYMALKNIHRIFEMEEYAFNEDKTRMEEDEPSRIILDWKQGIEKFYKKKKIDIHKCIDLANSMDSPNNVSFLQLRGILDEFQHYRKNLFGNCKEGKRWVKSIVRIVTMM